MIVKVIACPDSISKSGLQKITLTNTNESLKIVVDVSATLQRSITINYAEHDDTVLQVNLRDTTVLCDIEAVPIMQYVQHDSANINLDGGTARNALDLLRIVVDVANNEVFIAMRNSAEVELLGCEYVEVDTTVSVTGELVRLSRCFAKHHAAYICKAKLINVIDNYDSLSYMEAQLDVLTKLVLALAQNQPANAEHITMLTAADTHSVLNVKTAAKLIAEFNHKAKLRELQVKYYADKN